MEKYLRGRARYGSSPHFKSTLLRFTLQQRDKPFPKRMADPLEWVRERMRSKLMERDVEKGSAGDESLAVKVYKEMRETRPVKTVFS